VNRIINLKFKGTIIMNYNSNIALTSQYREMVLYIWSPVSPNVFISKNRFLRSKKKFVQLNITPYIFFRHRLYVLNPSDIKFNYVIICKMFKYNNKCIKLNNKLILTIMYLSLHRLQKDTHVELYSYQNQ
jgi:hypothetical protein